MLKVKPDNKGFTLVELIITVAIMTLIGVALVGIMTSNTVAFRKTKSDLDVQNVAEDTFNKISNDIMQAKAVYIKTVASGGTTKQYITKLNSKYITSDEQDLYDFFITKVGNAGDDFDTLKVEDTNTSNPKYSLTELDIAEIAIAYEVPYKAQYDGDSPSSNLYDNCVVKYDFTKKSGSNPGKVEVTYYYQLMDKLQAQGTCVYTDLLGADGVKGQVDAENDSIKLTMSFEKNDRKYKSDGMVTIRNSYVLAQPN